MRSCLYLNHLWGSWDVNKIGPLEKNSAEKLSKKIIDTLQINHKELAIRKYMYGILCKTTRFVLRSIYFSFWVITFDRSYNLHVLNGMNDIYTTRKQIGTDFQLLCCDEYHWKKYLSQFAMGDWQTQGEPLWRHQICFLTQ